MVALLSLDPAPVRHHLIHEYRTKVRDAGIYDGCLIHMDGTMPEAEAIESLRDDLLLDAEELVAAMTPDEQHLIDRYRPHA